MAAPRTIIESPFSAPDIHGFAVHRAYLIRALQHSIFLGEAPFAGHLMYTGALDDNEPVQRSLGIFLGQTWLFVADQVAFYMDYGFSTGMEEGRLAAALAGKPTFFRRIGRNPLEA